MKIIVPTLGRVNNQRTYNSFSEKYQKDFRFVVQPHEYQQMDEIYPGQVVVLPENIKGIGSTREWIRQKYKDQRYVMIDDDITAIQRRHYINQPDQKWKIHDKGFYKNQEVLKMRVSWKQAVEIGQNRIGVLQ